MPESLGRRGGAWRRRTAPPLIVQGQGGKWAFASGCLQRRCVSPLLRDTSRHGTRATATATSTRRRSYPFSAAAWPLAARPDRLRPPGFRLSTALLDSDNGPSFYATRMTHRFGGGDAMLPDSDDRCFLCRRRRTSHDVHLSPQMSSKRLHRPAWRTGQCVRSRLIGTADAWR
jgi:hypothetical protein